MRVVVMALDEQGAAVAVGPVAREASIERIREQIEARGWTTYGEARRLSVAEWEAECHGAEPAVAP